MFERLMIMRALSGAFEPTKAGLCSAEDDQGGGGGGGQPPAKTFTQDEVNRIAAKQKAEGEAAAKRAAEAAFTEKEQAFNKRIEELELAGKTQAERDAHERRQREEADRKAREAREASLAKERDDAKALAAANEARWKDDRKNTAVVAALHSAKVIAAAAADAAHSFMRDAKIEQDEDGVITNVIYGGKSYSKVDEAAVEFLKERSHFAQPAGTGGTGSRLPTSSGGGSPQGGRPLHEMTRSELLELDAQQQAQARK